MCLQKIKSHFIKPSLVNTVLLSLILIFLVVVAGLMFYQITWPTSKSGTNEIQYVETSLNQDQSQSEVKTEQRAGYLAVQFKEATSQQRMQEILKELGVDNYELAFPDMDEFKSWYRVAVPLMKNAEDLAAQFRNYPEIDLAEPIIE
ncbi:MAG: hypothetical protein WC480_00655 [Patescibacteria group bacterium]